jgi:hypothetical protein
MHDEGWLLFQPGKKPLDTSKHELSMAVRESATRWCEMDWIIRATKG